MNKRNRTRTPLLLALLGIAASGLVSIGCENPVGRKCFIGATPGPQESIVASPALECPSRQCLHVPQEKDLPDDSEYADLCTASCDSDDDCDGVKESPCQTGFTCAVAVTVGAFCCEKLCICRDYIVVPESGGLPVPAACDADNAANTCCNLPGRNDLPQCQM